MSQTSPKPAAGGRYERDPETGALRRAGQPAEKPKAKPSKPESKGAGK